MKYKMTLYKGEMLFYMLVLSYASWGQTSIHWSPDLKDGLSFCDAIAYNGKFYDARVSTNGFVYSVKNRTTFAKYDDKFNLELESKEAIKVETKKAVFWKFIVLEDKLFALLKTPGSVFSSDKLVLSQIDTADLSLSSAYLPLLGFEHENGNTNFHSGVANSPNGKLFLFLQLMKSKANNDQYVHALMLDEKGSSVVDSIFTIGKIQTNLFLSNVEVDDRGNFHFMSYTKKSILGEDRPRQNILGRFSQQHSSFESQLFHAIPGYQLEAMMVAGSDNNLCIAGHYRGASKEDAWRRIVSGTIGINSSDSISLVYQELPQNDVNSYLDENGLPIKRTPKIRPDDDIRFVPVLRKLFYWGEETIVMVSENYLNQEVSYKYRDSGRPSGSSIGVSSVQGLGDIRVQAFLPSGSKQWNATIPNAHDLGNPFNPRHSFLLSKHADELRVLIDNAVQDEFDDGLLMARVDREGNLKFQSIYAHSEEDVHFSPISSHQLTEETYFITGRQGLRYKYAILEIE